MIFPPNQAGTPENPVGAAPVGRGVSVIRPGEVLSLWWRERVSLLRWAIAGLVATAVVLLGILTFGPNRQETTLTFRLIFDGIDKGQYPNGTRFAPAHLVATPVLQEVYRRNGLAQFIEFEDFKDAFAVTAVNPATERLRREYQARVQDRRLASVDRKKLEDEYATRVQVLQRGEYTLVLNIGGTFQRWPETLAGKVMDDVLGVWVEQSRGRGLLRFDLNIFSENILNELNPALDDYPMLLDRMRVVIERVRKNLQELAATEGARLLRVEARRVSLGELDVQLQDAVKYRLSMIEAPVYTLGLFKERELTSSYITEQLFRLQREAQSTKSQIAAVHQSLAGYNASRAGGGAMPSEGNPSMQQSSGSFLDQMMDLSAQGTNVTFRQDLVWRLLKLDRELAELADERQVYEKMQQALNADGRKVELDRKEVEPWVQQQIAGMIEGLRQTLGVVRLLHAEIAQRNLQPSMVYSVPDPLEQRLISSLGFAKLVVVLGFGWALYLGLVLAILAWRGFVGR